MNSSDLGSRHLAGAASVALGLTMMGCPGDNGGEDEVGDTVGDSETGDGDGDTGDTTGDGDGDGEPTCPASLPGDYEPGQYELIAESVFTPSDADFLVLDELCRPAEIDFQWQNPGGIDWATVNLDGVDLAVYRPGDPVGGDWPVGQFPIVFHHHGNGGQDGQLYEHIAEAVVDDGAIFVSVAEDRSADPGVRAMIDICMLRWLFTQADWDGDGPGDGGAAKLDGNVVVMGHSNGGEGAHIVNNWFEERPWQADLDAPEHDMRLCGVVGIAPRGGREQCVDDNGTPDPGDDVTFLCNSPFSTGIQIAGDATVPYLAIEGSLDNDVPGGSLWNTSHSGIDEQHTPLDAAKINVWVYDAEHDSFGGCEDSGVIYCAPVSSIRGGQAIQVERGNYVAATYVDHFVRRFVFGDLGAQDVLFGTIWPSDLEMNAAEWWEYHPAYQTEPLVFLGSEPHQSGAPDEFGVRAVVDTMVRSDNLTCVETVIADGTTVTSEGGPFFADNWPVGSLRSDCARNLAAYPSGGADGQRYETFVIRADYGAPGDDADPAERTISWGLDFMCLDNAVTFSFRASNIDDVDMCAPVDGDSTDVAEFEVVFVGGEDFTEVPVSVADYSQLVAPDVLQVQGLGLMCPVSHFLQTIRIPLDEVLAGSFSPEELREVRFVFDRTAGPETRAVLLDTVEFHRDLAGESVCD